MSREIKFRAWDKEHHAMIDLGTHGKLCYGSDGAAKLTFGREWHDDYYDSSVEDFELMQYTGLKDKAGKDIYEGDIVVTENEQEGEWPVEGQYKGVVTYNDQRAAFYIQQPHDTYTPTLSNLAIKSIEVLGNIYEHPELIEGKL